MSFGPRADNRLAVSARLNSATFAKQLPGRFVPVISGRKIVFSREPSLLLEEPDWMHETRTSSRPLPERSLIGMIVRMSVSDGLTDQEIVMNATTRSLSSGFAVTAVVSRSVGAAWRIDFEEPGCAWSELFHEKETNSSVIVYALTHSRGEHAFLE